MSALKKALDQSTKYMVKPSLKRVVSTSPSHSQGIAVHVNSEAIGQCPFHKSMDTFADTFTLKSAPKATAVKPFKSIPGPKGLPVIGTLLDYFKEGGPRFTKMFEVFRQRSLEFGPIYYEKVGAFSTLVVSSPEMYSRLVQTEGKYPHRREMTPMVFYRKDRGINLGIVNGQGEEWYKQRTVVSKKMLKLNEVNHFSSDMGEVSDDFVSRLDKTRDDCGEVQGLERELFKWAMESFGTFMFEERIGCLSDQPTPFAKSFIENLEGFFKTMQPLLYNLPVYMIWKTSLYREFESYNDNLMEIGQQIIGKKISEMCDEESDSKSAFLSYLFNNSTMDMKEVTSLVVDLLLAATETTTTASLWCLYLLAKHPDVQENLLSEIETAKDDNGNITAEQLARLPYIKSIVKETLRLYPITYSTSRLMTEDTEIGGYSVPAQTHVQANLYGMYRDPKIFPEPESFKPERWHRQNSTMDPSAKAISNLVWGHGARMCMGRRIAEQEMHITISKIVQKFQLSYEHDDVEPVLNTLMVPDRPLKIKFTQRA